MDDVTKIIAGFTGAVLVALVVTNGFAFGNIISSAGNALSGVYGTILGRGSTSVNLGLPTSFGGSSSSNSGTIA